MQLPQLAAILARYEAAELDRTIDPADGMWKTGPDWYWSVGLSALHCVLAGLGMSWQSRDPGTIIDFGCGYGRVGRHLRAAFPASRFYWWRPDGATFCAKHFGGEAIISNIDPAAVELPAADVIWVGSMFTHMTEANARQWLHRLAGHLRPEGILVATFHGRRSTAIFRARGGNMSRMVDRIEADRPPLGWGFEKYDPAAPAEWGVSISSPVKLAEIGASIPDTHIGGIREAGWSNNHDVLTLVKRAV